MSTAITEIPDYKPPPAASPSSNPIPSVAATPSANMNVFCMISDKCQIEATIGENKPPKPLPCVADDFTCICGKTNTMGHNVYFSAHCIFTECTDVDARKAFMSRYMEGCTKISKQLTDIPAEWLPFAPSLEHMVPAPASSTTHEVVTKMTLSSQISTDTTTASQSSTMALVLPPPGTPMSATTSMADLQIPICGVSQKCLKKQRDHSPSCEADDLQCMCKASNSLANSTQFDQQCVFDECHGDIGLRELLHSLIYACQKVDHELTDIPNRWQPYLPSPSSTSPTLPTTTATVTTTPITLSLPNTPPTTQRPHLPSGAIAGIAVSVLLVLSVLVAMGIAQCKARKKAKALTRENAILADRTSAHGASARIEMVMAGAGRSVASLTDGTGMTLVDAGNRRETEGMGVTRQEGGGQEGYGKEGVGREGNGRMF